MDDSLRPAVARFERLTENLQRYSTPGIETIQMDADLLQLSGEDLPVPAFDLVYLDVPCSNTGVLQRRPDVKWRLSEESIRGTVGLQEALLRKAADFVKPGGYLIYSTCSIEPEENEALIEGFLADGSADMKCLEKTLALPWEVGHDGAGVFLLQRRLK